MVQFGLKAGDKWRISTKSKRTIAAKHSSAPGIGALDMINGCCDESGRERGMFYKLANQLLSWEFKNGA